MVMGLGMGAVMAPSMASATAGVAHADAGVASAMVNTGQQVGGSIGTALLSTVAASRGHFVRGRAAGPAGDDGRGRGPRLHHRVLVVGGDLRGRRPGHRAAAAERGPRGVAGAEPALAH